MSEAERAFDTANIGYESGYRKGYQDATERAAAICDKIGVNQIPDETASDAWQTCAEDCAKAIRQQENADE